MYRKIIAYGGYFEDFIESLTDKEQEKIQYALLLLKTQDRIPFKFIKLIRDGLYELRIEYSSNIYRIFLMIIGCYARPSLQGDVKNVSMFLKIFVLFCPVRDIISVEKHHPFTPRPAGDKMFSSSHYVPDGTLVTGGILLSTNMLSLTGQKTIFFRA